MDKDNKQQRKDTTPLPHREGQGESLQYIELYQAAGNLIKSQSADVMNAVRDEAFADFQRLGCPSKKVERYKYTDVAPL
jgi:hypothetical protein